MSETPECLPLSRVKVPLGKVKVGQVFYLNHLPDSVAFRKVTPTLGVYEPEGQAHLYINAADSFEVMVNSSTSV